MQEPFDGNLYRMHGRPKRGLYHRLGGVQPQVPLSLYFEVACNAFNMSFRYIYHNSSREDAKDWDFQKYESL